MIGSNQIKPSNILSTNVENFNNAAKGKIEIVSKDLKPHILKIIE